LFGLFVSMTRRIRDVNKETRAKVRADRRSGKPFRERRAAIKHDRSVARKEKAAIRGHLKDAAVKTFTNQAARVVSALAGSGTKITDNRMRGEMHGLLKLPNGKFGFANFMGPGTQIKKRIKRGIQGATPVDRLAKIHDIDYSLARTPRDVQKADMAFIRGLHTARQQGENTFNIRQGQLMVPKHAYERITGRTIFNDLKGPGNDGPFLQKARSQAQRQMYG
jgi:hypothetical protein